MKERGLGNNTIVVRRKKLKANCKPMANLHCSKEAVLTNLTTEESLLLTGLRENPEGQLEYDLHDCVLVQ